jgi:DNA-binding winged helix-turn-helix (wHTH) protein/tetratricopeptide (TPR) repeat protein
VNNESHLLFPPFRLDPVNEQLWRENQEIALRPKTFEVLRYLVEHPGRLVTKAALLDAVWREVVVSDSMPGVCIGELRKALGDGAKTPHFIETVHGRGYRFIAKVTTAAPDAVTQPPSVCSGPAPIVVGRDAELARVRSRHAEMLTARRQVLFVAGEAGIGKTTFVRAFLESMDTKDKARIGRGQCIEQYGSGEPYMPVLEALTRIAHGSGGERTVELLKRFAPSWVVQLTTLLTADERKQLQSETQGVTQQRMLREMAHALEALAAESPLVLVLEDLHWSDFSTLELISAIARRTEPARLMIVGTYRPVEMLATEHPLRTLKAELELHRQCNELRLKLLSEEDVAAYLAKRFADNKTLQLLDRVAPVIHARTEGNPLFMVNVVDYLVELGSLQDAVKIDPPRTIQQMIERNLERLHPEEQRVVEAASVAGGEFSAAAVAAALKQPLSKVEHCLMRLARRQQFVARAGAALWPDGTVASRFGFHHTLYADVLYERVAASQRLELHRRIAEREEAAYGEQAREIAAELAHHYRHANSPNKAIEYLALAGKAAAASNAFNEAEQSYRQAAALINLLPESAERDALELKLSRSIYAMLQMTRGYSAAETIDAAERAAALAEKSGSLTQLVNWIISKATIAIDSGDLAAGVVLADQALELALRDGNPTNLGLVYRDQINVRLFLGDLAGVEKHFAAGLRFFADPQFRQIPAAGVAALSFASQNAWHLGRAELARQRIAQMIAAANPSNPFELAFAEIMTSVLHLLMREYEQAEPLAARALELSEKNQLPQLTAFSSIALGWARAHLGSRVEGIALIRKAIARLAEIGTRSEGTLQITALAEAQMLAGAFAEALETINQVLQPNHPGLPLWRPKALRLRGELQLKLGRSELAEMDFRAAIELAARMSAKTWELPATTSLARLLRDTGRRGEACTMLTEIYNWFTDGFDTPDMKEAKALLNELEAPRS